MERVHSTSERAANDIEGVAIAVFQNRGHVGLLYKEEIWVSADRPAGYVAKILHLGLHEPLIRSDDESKWSFWVVPAIESEQSDLVSEYCQLIYQRNEGKVIPYGFGAFEGAFGESWALSDDASQWGLTCASFVLAVFHRSGIQLIKHDEWEVRADDLPTMEQLIRFLRDRTDATDEHIARQAALVALGQRRFRPLEVAGAASSGELPVGFERAKELASELAEEFDREETGEEGPCEEDSE